MLRRLLLLLALPLVLAACGAEPKWAPDADVARAFYKDAEPASITVYTVIRTRGGDGGHSSILINGSQRVLFDPAGTWWNPAVPERNDVDYGITPRILEIYIDYHARETYHVVEQKFYVAPEVAEAALRRVQGYGAVPKAMCARSVSDVLSDLPGFQSVPHTFFPTKIMHALQKLPNVQTRTFFDVDGDGQGPLVVLPGIVEQPPGQVAAN